MFKAIILIIFGLFLGSIASLIYIFYFYNTPIKLNNFSFNQIINNTSSKQIIGFLPYWLLDKAQTDYSKYVTTLSYFAIRISSDGSIQKLSTPTQEEAGWYALESGKVDPFLNFAKQNNEKLSLVVDSGDVNAINKFISNPEKSSINLISDVKPLLNKYGFSDLNLDIEYTQDASDQQRSEFSNFIKDVRVLLPKDKTLTLEISPIDAVQKRLIDIKAINPYIDHIVIMAYDYHAPDSFVTGPVAPLNGGGITSEYDVSEAIDKTLLIISPSKLILGIPLYGYEWEILGDVPRSAVIPGSGVIASNDRVENLLNNCTNCKLAFDSQAQESYVTFFSNDTNTTHLIYFPDITSTKAKVNFANDNNLGGLALWALGYEGSNILNPIINYKNN